MDIKYQCDALHQCSNYNNVTHYITISTHFMQDSNDKLFLPQRRRAYLHVRVRKMRIFIQVKYWNDVHRIRKCVHFLKTVPCFCNFNFFFFTATHANPNSTHWSLLQWDKCFCKKMHTSACVHFWQKGPLAVRHRAIVSRGGKWANNQADLAAIPSHQTRNTIRPLGMF